MEEKKNWEFYDVPVVSVYQRNVPVFACGGIILGLIASFIFSVQGFVNIILLCLGVAAVLELILFVVCRVLNVFIPPPDVATNIHRYVFLNGIWQSIRICSQETDPAHSKRPIVLIVHGGPCVPDKAWVIPTHVNSTPESITSHCTLVCWDQRHSGDTAAVDKLRGLSTVTVQTYIDDCYELCKYLCSTFNKRAIYVVGRSWGTVIGTLLTQQHPEIVAAYIGTGQMVSTGDNERISYDYTLNKCIEHNDTAGIEDLKRIGRPDEHGSYPRGTDDTLIQRKYMNKYNGGIYKHAESFFDLVVKIFQSPEYSLYTLIWGGIAVKPLLRRLWPQLGDLDFRKTVRSLESPTYMIVGAYDFNTPTELVREWAKILHAPRFEAYYLDECAHSPLKEKPAEWRDHMIHILETEEAANPTSI